MIDWFTLVLVFVLSSWLAYINWKARIGQSERTTEVNPIWAFFDKRGFEKIQFVIIPILFTGIAVAYILWGNMVGLGFIVGILVLNLILDATTLNLHSAIEDTRMGTYMGKPKTLKEIYRSAFILSVVMVITVTILIPFVFTYIAISFYQPLLLAIFVSVGIIWYIISKKFLGFRPIRLLKIYLFQESLLLHSDEGIPMKTELSVRESD